MAVNQAGVNGDGREVTLALALDLDRVLVLDLDQILVLVLRSRLEFRESSIVLVIEEIFKFFLGNDIYSHFRICLIFGLVGATTFSKTTLTIKVLYAFTFL